MNSPFRKLVKKAGTAVKEEAVEAVDKGIKDHLPTVLTLLSIGFTLFSAFSPQKCGNSPQSTTIINNYYYGGINK